MLSREMSKRSTLPSTRFKETTLTFSVFKRATLLSANFQKDLEQQRCSALSLANFHRIMRRDAAFNEVLRNNAAFDEILKNDAAQRCRRRTLKEILKSGAVWRRSALSLANLQKDF